MALQKTIQIPNTANFSLFVYNQTVIKTAIWQLKYYKHTELTIALITHSAKYITAIISAILTDSNQLASTIVFVPIPLSKKRHNARGFNQSELLCKCIQHIVPVSTIAKRLLVKIVDTSSQALSTNKDIRLKNVHNTMIVKRPCNNSSVFIIIDDVYTTGATIAEAKRALAEAGARHLYSITLAHG